MNRAAITLFLILVPAGLSAQRGAAPPRPPRAGAWPAGAPAGAGVCAPGPAGPRACPLYCPAIQKVMDTAPVITNARSIVRLILPPSIRYCSVALCCSGVKPKLNPSGRFIVRSRSLASPGVREGFPVTTTSSPYFNVSF